MEFLEVLTEGLEKVLMVRGGGREVITIFSWTRGAHLRPCPSRAPHFHYGNTNFTKRVSELLVKTTVPLRTLMKNLCDSIVTI